MANCPVRTFEAKGEGVAPYQVNLKSVHDDENIYMLVQWAEPSMEVDRAPWSFSADKKAWERVSDDVGDEDEMGFYWNVNVPNYQEKGCQDLCHQENPDHVMMYAPKGSSVDV